MKKNENEYYVIKRDVLHQAVLRSVLLANEKTKANEIGTVNRICSKKIVEVLKFPISVLIF